MEIHWIFITYSRIYYNMHRNGTGDGRDGIWQRVKQNRTVDAKKKTISLTGGMHATRNPRTKFKPNPIRKNAKTTRTEQCLQTMTGCLPVLKCERFVSPFSLSPSNGLFLESAISGDGHVSIPESAAILEFRHPLDESVQCVWYSDARFEYASTIATVDWWSAARAVTSEAPCKTFYFR